MSRKICSGGTKPSTAEIDVILKAASEGDISALLDLSVTKQIDVTAACNVNGVTTLHEAARSGNRKIIKLLIDAKRTIVDNKDKHGTTPLHVAAKNGYKRIMKELVKAGATIDVRDNLGVTPLHVAAKNGHKKAIKVLVQANALVDTIDMYGWTPLSSAVVNDNSGIVKYLVKDARADRIKVKYQFQYRIGVLLGEIEPSNKPQQQQSASPVQSAPHQRNIHPKSATVCLDSFVVPIAIFGLFCTYILPGGFSTFIYRLLTINF